MYIIFGEQLLGPQHRLLYPYGVEGHGPISRDGNKKTVVALSTPATIGMYLLLQVPPGQVLPEVHTA